MVPWDYGHDEYQPWQGLLLPFQLKTPEDALVRIKEAADVLKSDTKKELQKKAWPYIRNSLRLSVLYLRLDISTCIASKPKAEKKALTAEAKKLNDAIEAVRGHLLWKALLYHWTITYPKSTYPMCLVHG